MRAILFAILLALSAAAAGAPAQPPAEFSHDVHTAAKPWTHLRFLDDPREFRFAIVADRTGGMRPGVFETAVDRLNLLRPEFVISVGDLIQGYTGDENLLRKQWAEIDGIIGRLEMPFFYLPGNHDNDGKMMKQVYNQLRGQAYYSFVYKGVLFLCLDSQDVKSMGISPAQADWARGTLAAHSGVRWTFVFIHQPLWLYEEGALVTSRKDIETGVPLGFKPIEEALANRPHTVIAGHLHQYMYETRARAQYIVLGTTGGESRLNGPDCGEFDHAMWVTMTAGGPRFANLCLEGVLPVDVHTRRDLRFTSGIRFAMPQTDEWSRGARVQLHVENIFGHELSAGIRWDEEAEGPWKIAPPSARLQILPGQTQSVEFVMQYTGRQRFPRIPRVTGSFAAGSEYVREFDLSPQWSFEDFLLSKRPTTLAPRCASAPVIDGVLSDPAWLTAADVTAFATQAGGAPRVETEARVTWDDTMLYVAYRCRDPEMGSVTAGTTWRDGNVWEDDSVEVFLDPDADEKRYYHFIINAAGTLYDGLGRSRGAYNGEARTAAARGADAWTVELAVPWADLGLSPTNMPERMAFELARYRPKSGEFLQYPPLHGNNHRRNMFGFLTLKR